jgi:hypothetical protein
MSSDAARLAWVDSPGFSKRHLMKNYDSRTVSINDFVEWEQQGLLQLNPAFQRRQVWSDKAKSYLMDTIMRGKPIPKIFIRQKINVTTRKSVREVVDGQQRVRTILSFIKDGFVVSKTQNLTHGGVRFSQLAPDVQEQILTYEVSVDLLINLSDAEILDIFSRLNSYAVLLNEQEKLNSNHFGPFKILCDNIGKKYYEYWTKQDILTTRNILRMLEVSLVADLIIAMKEGIKSKKQLRRYYDLYEDKFNSDVDEVERNFDEVISTIGEIYPDGLSGSEFSRPHLFYSLFTAVAHCLYGLPGLKTSRGPTARVPLNESWETEGARNGLDRVESIFATTDVSLLTVEERQFLTDSRRATTDEAVRQRRTNFLVGLMG